MKYFLILLINLSLFPIICFGIVDGETVTFDNQIAAQHAGLRPTCRIITINFGVPSAAPLL